MTMKWSVMPKTHAALMMRDQIGEQVKKMIIKVLLEVLHTVKSTVYTAQHSFISISVHKLVFT